MELENEPAGSRARLGQRGGGCGRGGDASLLSPSPLTDIDRHPEAERRLTSVRCPLPQRGDLLFLSMPTKAPIKLGDITVYKIPGAPIPIVHRVIETHDVCVYSPARSPGRTDGASEDPQTGFD